MNKQAIDKTLQLEITRTSLASMMPEAGGLLWNVQLFVVNATNDCYIGDATNPILVPAGTSQSRVYGIVDLSTIFVWTSDAVKSSANTLVLGMTKASPSMAMV
jgi:hypothetical protein